MSKNCNIITINNNDLRYNIVNVLHVFDLNNFREACLLQQMMRALVYGGVSDVSGDDQCGCQ